MQKYKLTVILIFALCFTLSLSLVTFAQNESASKEQNFRIIANDSQIKILQDLYLTDISYGELLEKVYPEALGRIPEKVLKNMYQVKVDWKKTSSKSMSSTSAELDGKDAVSPKFVIGVNHQSTVTKGQGYISYNSGSNVVLPYPWYQLPYMSVFSILVQDDIGPVASMLDAGSNTFSVLASGTYNSPLNGKIYYTTGDHFGEHPAGYNPPTYTSITSSGMIVY